jgi:hypothetical protein
MPRAVQGSGLPLLQHTTRPHAPRASHAQTRADEQAQASNVLRQAGAVSAEEMGPMQPLCRETVSHHTCIWPEDVENRPSAFRDLFPLLQEVPPQS